MNQQSTRSPIELTVSEQPQTIINCSGYFVAVNEKAGEMFREEPDSLIGTSFSNFQQGCQVKNGRELEWVLTGEVERDVSRIERGDGSVADVDAFFENLEDGDDQYVRCTIQEIEEVEPATDSENSFLEPPNESTFDDISAEELDELAQNIRVDAPDGEMPLNAIMLDLAVGHNEIEQYKQGALTLHKAVDERLKEEEKRNPDSKVCDVLREVKRSAFGLYLRIQRGDQELHGERDGEYSGYFN
jgi:hypothetical protein